MTFKQAQLYLQGLKKQVRQRELYEALDIAIEALAWKDAEEKGKKKEPKMINVETDIKFNEE